MRFIVESEFWSLFPEARIGVVIARGMRNTLDAAQSEHISAMLTEAMQQASNAVQTGEISEHPAIAPWREAYRKFGVKPAKFRSSIENLVRSARSGNVRGINPLVDLYNTVSLKHLLPCGGEDLAAIRGDIRLTRATGNEHFVPLGSTEAQPPQSGEVIYRDDEGVICRCWNWREAERTKLTEATTDAFLCIEALLPITDAALQTACDDLAALIRETLGGEATTTILTTAHREIVF